MAAMCWSAPCAIVDSVYDIDFEALEAATVRSPGHAADPVQPQSVGKHLGPGNSAAHHGAVYKHSVLVLSDEITRDLTDPGKEYTPMPKAFPGRRGSASPVSRPTKAFQSGGGIQSSAVIVPNPRCSIGCKRPEYR